MKPIYSTILAGMNLLLSFIFYIAGMNLFLLQIPVFETNLLFPPQ